MIAESLQHRSGRIIALCRLTLAVLFILALLLDPAQPVRNSGLGYALLCGYLVIALLLLLAAWTSWWVDHLLAFPSYAVDVLVFLAAVYFTESLNEDFTSPFLAFFAFLMLAATIRWDWRATAVAAGTICACYLAVGLMMEQGALEFDTYRFGRRTAYMAVLALVLIWFGLERHGLTIAPFHPAADELEPDQPPLALACEYVAEQTTAQGAAICWQGDHALTLLLYRTGSGAESLARGGVGDFTRDDFRDEGVALFSHSPPRMLRREAAESIVAERAADLPWLARHYGIAEGVAAPLISSSGYGQLVIFGISGMSVDHLTVAHALAREISAAFDRQALALLAQQSALERTREAIARDLHDSVAQSLAAASYRLEALRTWIRDGNDPEPEIAELKQALRNEQRHVRGLIAGLRPEAQQRGARSDLAVDLARLIEDLADFWRIEALLDGARPLSVSLRLSHEIQQLVREGIANAVRHGQARRVHCRLRSDGESLHITIEDNGSGIATGLGYDIAGPRSIRDRVAALGGTLRVGTSAQGTTLDIAMTTREKP